MCGTDACGVEAEPTITMPHVYSRSGPSSAARPAAHRSASVTFPSTLRLTASFGLSWSEVAMIVTTNL